MLSYIFYSLLSYNSLGCSWWKTSSRIISAVCVLFCSLKAVPKEYWGKPGLCLLFPLQPPEIPSCSLSFSCVPGFLTVHGLNLSLNSTPLNTKEVKLAQVGSGWICSLSRVNDFLPLLFFSTLTLILSFQGLLPWPCYPKLQPSPFLPLSLSCFIFLWAFRSFNTYYMCMYVCIFGYHLSPTTRT